MITPETIAARSKARKVTKGIAALRSAWRSITRRGPRPFARAVTM